MATEIMQGASGVEPERRRKIDHEIGVGLAGALAGAATGAFAGPTGLLAGAIMGAIVGALAGASFYDHLFEEEQRRRTLDADAGMTRGAIGASNLAHPQARFGTYSIASAGAGPLSDAAPAEGPTPPPE
jgi:hypothetical protein